MSTLGKHWKMPKEAKEKLRQINLGKKHSEASKKKQSETIKGKNHWNYKGEDNVLMGRKHKIIEIKYGKPNYCEICKSTKKKKYEWSNKYHKYNMKKEYWQRLCNGCHQRFDFKFNNKTRKEMKQCFQN